MFLASSERFVSHSPEIKTLYTHGDFPDYPVVRTQHFHSRVHGFIPSQGIKILHSTLHGQNPKQQQKQTKKSKTTQTKNYTCSMFNFNWTNILFSNVICTVFEMGWDSVEYHLITTCKWWIVLFKIELSHLKSKWTVRLLHTYHITYKNK